MYIKIVFEMGNVYTRDVSSLRRIYSTEQETGSRIHEIE